MSRRTTNWKLITPLALIAVATLIYQKWGFEGISFETSDDARIHGDLYPGGDHAVVLAHGGVFNKESWKPLAMKLSSSGLTVLAIDFRGYGRSTEGSDEGALHLDVLGAIQFLKGSGARRVSLVGASMGGGAVGEAVTMIAPGEIDRVVLLAATGIEAPEKMSGNKLFVVSAGDASVEDVRDQFNRAPEPKKLVVLPGDAHAQHIFKTQQANLLTETITQWLHEK